MIDMIDMLIGISFVATALVGIGGLFIYITARNRIESKTDWLFKTALCLALSFLCASQLFGWF